jgi:hypothetical protein
MVYETIKETATEDEKASTPWGTYALIGGGVLLVGVAGFFAYRQLSKK